MKMLELSSPWVSAILRTQPFILTDVDGVVLDYNDLAVSSLDGVPEICKQLSIIKSDSDEIILSIIVSNEAKDKVCMVRVVENYGYVIMLKEKPVRPESDIIHQIRNGMSIIHAMLEIEISSAPENEINRLMISQARIKAMAAVYDQTIANHNEDVDAIRLIAVIMANGQTSFMRRQQVKAADTSNIKISAKKALYFGLIIAEIAIHIAKYCDAEITIVCDDKTIKISAPANLPELPDLSKNIIEGYLVKVFKGQYQIAYDEFSVEFTIITD